MLVSTPPRQTGHLVGSLPFCCLAHSAEPELHLLCSTLLYTPLPLLTRKTPLGGLGHSARSRKILSMSRALSLLFSKLALSNASAQRAPPQSYFPKSLENFKVLPIPSPVLGDDGNDITDWVHLKQLQHGPDYLASSFRRTSATQLGRSGARKTARHPRKKAPKNRLCSIHTCWRPRQHKTCKEKGERRSGTCAKLGKGRKLCPVHCALCRARGRERGRRQTQVLLTLSAAKLLPPFTRGHLKCVVSTPAVYPRRIFQSWKSSLPQEGRVEAAPALYSLQEEKLKKSGGIKKGSRNQSRGNESPTLTLEPS